MPRYRRLTRDPRLWLAGYYKAFFTVFERFGAFAVLGFLFCLTYPRHINFVCVLVFGSAVILELLEIYLPGRDARVLDIIEKLAGGAAGIMLGDIVPSRFQPGGRE